MEHGTIFLDVLTVSNRLRHLDAAKVASIAASMDEIGLQQPVSVWASDDDAIVELVAGAHRVAAAKNLGWDKIDCGRGGQAHEQHRQVRPPRPSPGRSRVETREIGRARTSNRRRSGRMFQRRFWRSLPVLVRE